MTANSYVTPMSFVLMGDEGCSRTKPGRRFEAIESNPMVCIEVSRFDESTGDWVSVVKPRARQWSDRTMPPQRGPWSCSSGNTHPCSARLRHQWSATDGEPPCPRGEHRQDDRNVVRRILLSHAARSSLMFVHYETESPSRCRMCSADSILSNPSCGPSPMSSLSGGGNPRPGRAGCRDSRQRGEVRDRCLRSIGPVSSIR